MTKRFTVTGSSATRPTGLPPGFEVEETDAPFDRKIDSHLGMDAGVRLSEEEEGTLLRIRPYLYDDAASSWVSLRRGAVAELRDALTEWLGGAEPKMTAPAVVNHGDPEPLRDAVYVDSDGFEWSYRDSLEEWCYSNDGEDRCPVDTWRGLTDRGPSATEAAFPWTPKTA